jgi:3-oxoacyl-[acyl-carrier protein] reductase
MNQIKKQAIITGGTRGIGRAICIELAKNGYDIAFTYRSSQDEAKKLEEELKQYDSKAKGFQIDQSNTQSITLGFENILKDFSTPTLLVNNAGISIDGLSLRYKIEDFDNLYFTNVRGAFVATQSILRTMMKQKTGSIIFISSVIGQMGNIGQTAYSATKSALIGMTKSLARELGSRNIRVNAIAPGFIKTDMTDTLPETAKEAMLSNIPLGFLGEPQDIANVVLFLASDSARYITGQVIAVNGGLYM